MRTFLILFFIVFLLSNVKAQVANKIDKLDVNQLRLPKESISKASYIDATGQVKSSTVTDTELGYLSGLTGSISTSLAGKEPSISSGTTSQYWRGDKSWQTLDKNAVGLGNVQNADTTNPANITQSSTYRFVSDTEKSTWNSKENSITPGTTSQYFRGDKTFQTLDKSAVGLSNVDNTSDANKPISTATQTALNLKANDTDVVKLTGNQSISGIKTFTGKIVASTTINGSIPCPVMTQTQRNAFSASQGDCVYNTTSLELNVYDGTTWKSAGGSGGGISLWLTGTTYAVDTVVIESDKIYRCLIAHTSGTFATDLAALKWVEVSQGLTAPVSLSNGGTNKNITPVSGSIVYVDADSFEQISGTSGQVLQSNGSSAPTFVNKSISAKSQNSSSVTAEEIQFPNNLLTQVDTNKHLNETGNKNILSNPSFEHSTFSTSWTNSAGTFTKEISTVIDGKASAKLVLSAQTMSLVQSSTLYQTQFADGVQGLASVRIKSDVALKVCSIQAGTVSTTNCVNVQSNNKWGFYKVPMLLGATSNGISIASTGAVSGTVYIDDAFVGATDIVQNSNACQTADCTTQFSAKVTSTGVITSENIDFILGDCTKPSTGIAKCTFNTTIFTVAPTCVANRDITTQTTWVSNTTMATIGQTTSSDVYILVTDTGQTAMGFNLICTKQGVDFITAQQKSNGGTYSSTNADTDWEDKGVITVTSTAGSPTKGVTTIDKVLLKRTGTNAEIIYKYQQAAGSAGSGEYLYTLPDGLEFDTSVITPYSGAFSTALEAAGQNALIGYGHATTTLTTNRGIVSLFAYNSTQFRAIITSGFSSWQVQNASYFAYSGAIAFNFRINVPISGWQNSNVIIGQFNGLESCESTLDCTDTF